jgi:hypothetical protein
MLPRPECSIVVEELLYKCYSSPAAALQPPNQFYTSITKSIYTTFLRIEKCLIIQI